MKKRSKAQRRPKPKRHRPNREKHVPQPYQRTKEELAADEDLRNRTPDEELSEFEREDVPEIAEYNRELERREEDGPPFNYSEYS